MNEIKIPKHVAIILDGNGRWAKEKGLSRSKGHDAGFENLKKISRYIFSQGIEVLSVYAFSTENFKRSEAEVGHLMEIFLHFFKTEMKKYEKENIKIVFSGREEPLKPEIIKAMREIEEKTKQNTGGIFNICINYGGMAEITDAIQKISKEVIDGKIKIETITEDLIENYLYQTLPPIDFLIRTSGEYRVSNFMLWQLSYAEMYFPKVYFPDFNEQEFDKALIEYTKRDRRFGGIKNENENC